MKTVAPNVNQNTQGTSNRFLTVQIHYMHATNIIDKAMWYPF